MPTARDLLQRFRPIGTPGAAAPAGVPADRVAELSRELQPVFDALADAEEEADRIRTAAAAQARARVAAAEQQAAVLVDAGRRDAEAARAEITAESMRRAEAHAAAALATGEQDAAAVTERAAARYAGLAERVVHAVWESAGIHVTSPAP
jgi:vacuolar-type H+-ATPase subunit H